MNLNGDYLSDALAAQVGGIGIAPGGNINYVTGHAIFEATHGTAPKYANQDKVNPGSVILSGEMMLALPRLDRGRRPDHQGHGQAPSPTRRVTYDFARLMEGATEVKCSEFGPRSSRTWAERRHVNIHEYQGKQYFAKYGIPIPKGIPAFSVPEARRPPSSSSPTPAARWWSSRRRSTPAAAAKRAASRSSRARPPTRRPPTSSSASTLVTHQTGPKGKKVSGSTSSRAWPSTREFYLAMVLDRETRRVVVMASTEGGMEIEKVAAETPEKILKRRVDPAVGLQPYQCAPLAFALGLPAKQRHPARGHRI